MRKRARKIGDFVVDDSLETKCMLVCRLHLGAQPCHHSCGAYARPGVDWTTIRFPLTHAANSLQADYRYDVRVIYALNLFVLLFLLLLLLGFILCELVLVIYDERSDAAIAGCCPETVGFD